MTTTTIAVVSQFQFIEAVLMHSALTENGFHRHLHVGLDRVRGRVHGAGVGAQPSIIVFLNRSRRDREGRCGRESLLDPRESPGRGLRKSRATRRERSQGG